MRASYEWGLTLFGVVAAVVGTAAVARADDTTLDAKMSAGMSSRSCSERLASFELKHRLLELQIADADDKAQAAASLKTGEKDETDVLAKDAADLRAKAAALDGQATKDVADKTKHDQDEKDAKDARDSADTLDARAKTLKAELELTDQRRKDAADTQILLWREQQDLEANLGWSCLPPWALEIGILGSAGAGSVRRGAIELVWRYRLDSTLAAEVDYGFATTQGILDDNVRHMMTISGRVRHGHGNSGEFYYGPGIAIEKTDHYEVGALFAQVGYSLSPQRATDSPVGGDLRVFIEPWIPLSSRGGSVLFGFAFDLALYSTTRR